MLSHQGIGVYVESDCGGSIPRVIRTSKLPSLPDGYTAQFRPLSMEKPTEVDHGMFRIQSMTLS
jgi:hypothetical protein